MADEKQATNVSESQLSRSDDDGQEIAWTEDEEKALVRRIDLVVMPLLILAFFALQIDRGNIGNAMTDFFLSGCSWPFHNTRGHPLHLPLPCLFGKSCLFARHTLLLQQRVLRDDPTKAHTRRNVSWAEIKSTFTNWRLLPHIFMTLLGMAPASTLMAYAPSLVVSFGFDRLKSNAMMSIGAWILIFTNLAWGTIADKIKLRGPMVVLGVLLLWGFTLGNYLLIESKNPNLRFAILVVAVAFQAPWHAVNGSWLALNARTAGERSITMAIFIMSANIAGIIGSQIFQEDDGPLYKRGWAAILSVVTVALAMAIIANLQYWLLNRFQKRKGEERYHY